MAPSAIDPPATSSRSILDSKASKVTKAPSRKGSGHGTRSSPRRKATGSSNGSSQHSKSPPLALSGLKLKPLPTKEDYRPKKTAYPDGAGTKYPKPASFSTPPQPVRVDANDPSITIPHMITIIERDGGVIVENLISKELAAQIKQDLAPVFSSDKRDTSGFFPESTQRATGLFGVSDACVEYGVNPIFIDIANAMISSTHEFWLGRTLHSVREKPVISSTVAFRVNPGGEQQHLHRDDQDCHAKPKDFPCMIGCVTALTKTTKENGATVLIPGSHKWDDERPPYVEEAVAAELEPGDGLIFLGNVYHAGGANTTKDQARETIGTFLAKPIFRQVDNQYLMVPPEKAKHLSPKAQRLLGYGVCRPNTGFYQYQDPMKVLFGIEDEDTVEM